MIENSIGDVLLILLKKPPLIDEMIAVDISPIAVLYDTSFTGIEFGNFDLEGLPGI